MQVIAEIGAAEVPKIEVYNKMDLLDGSKPHIQRDKKGQARRVWLSAHTGEGLDLLAKAIGEHFARNWVHGWLRLPATAGRLRARLYALDVVLKETVDNHGALMLEVEISKPELEQLCQNEGFDYQSVAIIPPAP